MSEFPKFENPAPIVVPPVQEKTFSKLWLHRMIIEAPSPQEKSTVYMEFIPYDGAGQTLPAPIYHNTIPDAFGAAAIDPQFAYTMGMVFAMLNKYKDIDFGQPFVVWSDGSVHQPPEDEPMSSSSSSFNDNELSESTSESSSSSSSTSESSG